MVLRNVIEVDEEKPLFQLFFLRAKTHKRVLSLSTSLTIIIVLVTL